MNLFALISQLLSGDNDDNFVITGFNDKIKESWNQVGMAALVGTVKARDTLVGGINDILEDLAKEGVKKLVMGAVSYVLIGVI